MNLMQLIRKLDDCMENLDLVTARKYIEENMDLLIENKNHLKRNVRELLDVLIAMPKNGEQPLNAQELNIIHALNRYATDFDLRGLKLSVKNNADLLMREDVSQYLNADAKVLLEGLSAI